jgi:hypothetical protein
VTRGQGALARGELPFRDNPFEQLSPRALASIFRWPQEACRFLAGEGDCLHVVGECGMGKTALLEQIRHRLASKGVPALYACIPVEGDFEPEPAEPGAVLLLDETDRLSRRTLGSILRLLVRERGRAALAAHRSQLRQIRRAGLSAVCVELRPLSSAEEVAGVFEARTVLAAGTEQHACRLTREATEALLHHSRGNIERCLALGYEIFQDLDRPRPIQTADVEAAAASLARAREDVAGSR